jgi:hypothetical protein
MKGSILDILEGNTYSLFVVELWNDGIIEKSRVFQASIEGFLEALQYVMGLPFDSKRLKAAAIIKMVIKRGGKAKMGNDKYIKWYYLP